MLQAGERVGAYEVIRLIARGGMATVYEAWQPALERAVALKRLDLRTEDPTLAQRFLRESRIAASFDHPNIVTVYDFLEVDGVPYIAMEYLPRGSLRPCVGGLTPPQAFGVLESVLAALAHAEERGIAHRDLKPENVLITTRGGAKIADFGIAKAYTNVTGSFTAAGVALGTPAYMAPEQALVQPVGPSTDLYAAGVMAFELLSGAPPFPHDDESPLTVMYRHVSEPPPRLDGADPRIADWVERMLAKRPEDRPPGAAQAWSDLEEVVVDLLGPYWRRDARLGSVAGPEPATRRIDDTVLAAAPTAVPRPPEPTPLAPARPPPGPPRRRTWAAGLVMLGLASAVAVALAVGGTDPPRRPAATPTAAAEPAAAPRRPAVPFDFDGNGRAVAVAGVTDAGRRAAGVVVLVGSQRRITAPRPRRGLDFGAAVASADFDRDGYADLAVGAPGADQGGDARREGVVYVHAGSETGLSDRPSSELPWTGGELPYSSARFGTTLAAGRLDGDRYPDLAVGVPGSDAGAQGRSGSVQIFFGSADGLQQDGSQTLRRRPRSLVRFGAVLTIADVDRDGHGDLIEAAPGESGHATYCPGRAKGPRSCRLLPASGPGPAALAAADLTGDGPLEVLHGVPDAGDGVPGAGAVQIWRGGRDGPLAPPLPIVQGVTDEVIGHDQPGDGFGAALAVGRIDDDRHADVVVGTPGEDLENIARVDAGRVGIFFGGPDGFDVSRDSGASAESPGLVQAQLPSGSRLGSSLMLLHLDRDRSPELVMAAPGARRIVTMRGLAGRPFALDRVQFEPMPGSAARLASGAGSS